MTHDPIDPLLASAELAHVRFSDTTLDGFIDRMVSLAETTVPGADEVSVTLVGHQGPYTAAYTGELALRLDERQYEHGRGPCLQAADEHGTIAVPDLRVDTRWGNWAPEAAAAGAGSVLSVGLRVSEDIGGALNLYGRAAHAFDGEAPALAEVFARYAAAALANAHAFYGAVTLAAQLRRAMQSRAVIEQAKGVIMAQRLCAADEAFAYIAKKSQDSNRKVRDVAVAIIAGLPVGSAVGKGHKSG